MVAYIANCSKHAVTKNLCYIIVCHNEMGMLIFIVLIFVFTDLLYIIYNKYITIYVLPLPIPEGLCIDDTTYQYCPQDVLWNEGIAFTPYFA